MIFLENISKSFSNQLLKPKISVINNISFEIVKGSVTGFLGANGAGKSTIIKIVMGFVSPDQGTVLFSPELGKDRREIFSNIGFLSERPLYYPHLSGEVFLKYLGNLGKKKTPNLSHKINSLAERLKLSQHLEKKINTYSKGMLQRLGIISVLINSPKILVLDEPLSGMDPLGRKEIKNLFLELNEQGKTIFFSTHLLQDIEDVCQRVVVLNSGKLKFDGQTCDFMPFKKNFTIRILGTLDTSGIEVQNAKYSSGITTIELSESNLADLVNRIESQRIISIIRRSAVMEEIFNK